MSTKMGIGERMKTYYEKPYNYVLPYRLPIIVRIDGKAFHTFTKGCSKPFDPYLIKCMSETAAYLIETIDNARFAYVQSDEISLFLHNYNKLGTQPWFNNEIQKITSISASKATAFFNGIYASKDKLAEFDSRVFVVPENEVVNYFIWRQQDWVRNSVQMLGQANFSHKELQGLSCNDIQNKLFTEKGINWSELMPHLKNGITCFRKTENQELTSYQKYFKKKTIIDYAPLIFTSNREYVEKWLKVEES